MEKPAQPAPLTAPTPQQVSTTVVPFDRQGEAPLKQCGNAWPFPPGPAPLPGGVPFKSST